MGIKFGACAGTSAGATHLCSYLSEQRERNKRLDTVHSASKRYMSWGNLIRTGDFFELDYCYNQIPRVVDPFDFEKFRENTAETKFYAVATNLETGDPEYLLTRDLDKPEDMDKIRASASLPLMSHIVEVDAYHLFELSAHTEYKIDTRFLGDDLNLLNETREHFESEISVSHNPVEENCLNVIIRAHDPEQEADIFVFICDVREILHAHYSDLVIEIIDKSGILIYKYDAASGCLDCFICEFDHPLGLAASFMSNQKLHHRSVPPLSLCWYIFYILQQQNCLFNDLPRLFLQGGAFNYKQSAFSLLLLSFLCFCSFLCSEFLNYIIDPVSNIAEIILEISSCCHRSCSDTYAGCLER